MKLAFKQYLDTKEGKDYQKCVEDRNAVKSEVNKVVRNYCKQFASIVK